MGGEDVVDYARRFKRIFAADHPWLIGYAYEVPCYIPSVRILKEGGYEAESSLIYYGIYGPFRAHIEGILIRKMTELVGSVRDRKSTRLNSSHGYISYAVFCLKKKKTQAVNTAQM